MKRVGKDTLTVERMPLELQGGSFSLAKPVTRSIRFDREIPPFGRVKPGDWVSVHWGFACEVLTPQQVRNAKKYTDIDIAGINAVLRALHSAD